jgi:hypothetical protein
MGDRLGIRDVVDIFIACFQVNKGKAKHLPPVRLELTAFRL